MKKLLNISLCLILTLNFGYSQSIKRNVISSFGASSNTANSIVETTFGQPPNIGTISDGNNYVRQGFQQPLYNFIMMPGCTDSLALNYDANALIDDGSCLLCYATADIGADTITSCDSVQICVTPDVGVSYCWESETSANSGNWEYVGNPGFSSGVSTYQTMKIDYNGIPYIAFREESNSPNGLSIMKYENNNWQYVGQSNMYNNVTDISLDIDRNNTPYVAFAHSSSEGRALKFDGTNWITLATSDFAANPINRPEFISLGISPNYSYASSIWSNHWSGGDSIFVAFTDNSSDILHLKRVHQTNPVNQWIDAGGLNNCIYKGSFVSLNFDNNSMPVIVYQDHNLNNRISAIRMAWTGGPCWFEGVGSSGFSSGSASHIDSDIDQNGIIYVSYTDHSLGNRMSVMKFDGTNWVYVGSPGFSQSSIAYSSIKINDNGVPYVAFQDYSNGLKATVMKFDGQDWVNIGNAGFSDGMSDGIVLDIYNGIPYVMFQDDAHAQRVSVMRFSPQEDTTDCLWVNSSGTYHVTVTDSLGCTATDSVYVSLNTPVSGSSSVTACDTYTWEGQTVTSSGNLTHTYQSALGCDSVHTLSVTINNSTSNSITIIACDSYTWLDNGTAYISGTYTAVSTNAAGCDHTETLDLTITSSTSNTTTLTECDSYIWLGPLGDGQTYTTSGTYTYTNYNSNAAGCDHTETLDLTINNSTTSTDIQVHCNSYTWLDGVTYTASNNTAIFISSNAAGCNNVATLDLTINLPAVSYTNITGCDSVVWNGTTYTTSGIYNAAFLGGVTPPGTVSTLTYCMSSTAIDFINFLGFSNEDATIEEVILIGDNNSITNNTAGVIDYYEDYTATMYADITEGQSYTVDLILGDFTAGSYPTAAKVFIDYNIDGDFDDAGEDIGMLNSTGTSPNIGVIYFTVPSTGAFGPTRMRVVSQDPWSNGGASNIGPCDYADPATTNDAPWFGATEDYSIVLTNPSTIANGCDSTAVLFLTINNSTSSYLSVTECNSYTWSVNGTAYTTTGTYTNVTQNAAGCDHTETLDLTITSSTSNTTTLTECDSYIWLGPLGTNDTITVSGTYTHVTQNAAGCTHTENLVLTINNSTSNTTTLTECDYYTWAVDGQTYTTSGTYTYIVTGSNGCNSTARLNLTINYSTTSSETRYECDAYIWNGTTFTTSGTYTYSTTNAVNCDSTATLILTIADFTTSTTIVDTCDTYTWNGQTYTTSGVYTFPTQNAAMCDSIASLDLTINYSATSLETITACDSYTWSNGITYTATGIHNELLYTSLGCDSLITLDLTIIYSTTSITTVTACDAYTWNGNTYTTSGVYIWSGTNAAMCDSTATLDLTINYSTASSETRYECDDYTWNGVTYTVSGTYIYSTTNAANCDSTATLILTIADFTTSTTIVTACDSWPWNGNIYTTSGTYTYSTTNSVGCDSIATLNLTINPSTVSTTNISECYSYTWNGQTYTTSGVYTYVTVNANGCDSTATLNLTIGYSTTSISTVIGCDSYTWNGTTYTASGTYTFSTINGVGCDSTATLELTINNSTTSASHVTECDTYTWNGQAYTISGSYTYILTGSNGCDSIAILVLTIDNSATSTEQVIACDSYTWNGIIYTATGTHNHILYTSLGCDSLLMLDLTIINSTTSLTTVDTCDTYTWNGATYTTTGIYDSTFTNVAGCDSTATLVLTINPSATSDSIQGLSQAFQGSTESYVPFPSNTSSTYLWGSILNSIIYTSSSGDSIAIAFMVPGNELIYFIETTSDGCSGDTVWMQIIIEAHTGINQIQIDDLNIYPNPSRDIFNIEFSSLITQTLQISIINSIGGVVFIDNLENYIGEYKKQINLKEYSQAIYFLEITTEDGVINKKLILQ